MIEFKLTFKIKCKIIMTVLNKCRIIKKIKNCKSLIHPNISNQVTLSNRCNLMKDKKIFILGTIRQDSLKSLNLPHKTINSLIQILNITHTFPKTLKPTSSYNNSSKIIYNKKYKALKLN